VKEMTIFFASLAHLFPEHSSQAARVKSNENVTERG
jgi:hypothetical protein